MSRRSDCIEDKEPLLYSILKSNLDGSLSTNVLEFNYVLSIVCDDKEYLIVQGKIQVPRHIEDEIIRRYYDDPTFRHLGIARTLEKVKVDYSFPKIKSIVT